MMSSFFEYDPLLKRRVDYDYDEEKGDAHFHITEDVSHYLDHAKDSSVNGLRDHGIKESWFNYALIPPVVILKMRAKGIDIFNKDHADRVYAEINSNYPLLKMTQKNIGGKEKRIVS